MFYNIRNFTRMTLKYYIINHTNDCSPSEETARVHQIFDWELIFITCVVGFNQFFDKVSVDLRHSAARSFHLIKKIKLIVVSKIELISHYIKQIRVYKPRAINLS